MKILVAVEAVDARKGIDSLARLCEEKLQTDPFVGQLTFFRVYSGTIEAGSYIYNPRTRNKERIGRILRMHANDREEVKQVYAFANEKRHKIMVIMNCILL